MRFLLMLVTAALLHRCQAQQRVQISPVEDMIYGKGQRNETFVKSIKGFSPYETRGVFQIAYVILKAANSPRPGNWILERSIDGVTYEPWQYYAITETECETRFNIEPRKGPPSYTRDDEVICTSFYSKIHPLENGEIHTSLINGRPSADDPSQALLNFTSARYIRFVFQRIRTLNADLMTLTLHNPEDIDPIVTRRYYYSIKDISVGGMCICYGHAKACPLNTATKKFSCECEHNTCGESCDRCCPGYHQQPWMAGTFLTRHVCEKCNCHGKADECHFNQTVADLSLSLDIHGKYRGGGVCIGCRNNTAGINCQSCITGYYRPTEPSQQGHVGVRRVLGVCDVTGRRDTHTYRKLETHVDRCAVGYMDYPFCQRCNCSMEGSTNADPCITPCVCKETTLTGWHLVGDTGGKVWSVHRQTPPYLSVRHADVISGLGSAYYWNAPGLYLGNKLTAYGGSIVYTVSYTTDQQEPMAIRVTSEPDLIIEGGGIKIIDKRFGRPVYPSSPSTNQIVLLPENFLISETAQPISRRDFLSVLASVTRVMVRASYSTEFSAVYRLHSFSMEVANPATRGEKTASAVEMCSCPPGYAGTSCEMCIPGFRRVNGNLYNGVCEVCQCHGHATQCHEITGYCLDCSHYTTGPYCDTCLPGYYGIGTRGSPVECQPCACPLSLPSNRCSNGYYGKPSVPGGSCQPCDCHGNLDLSTPGSCDPITGQCLHCRQGYGGGTCDSCAEGYYGDAITAKNCQPCECSHLGNNCDANSGQCICPPNTIGERCDRCAPNHWGHDIITGCKECGCSVIGSVTQQCNVNTGCCSCRDSFRGEKCNECQIGFRDFPQENVEGDNCDRCKPDTFGLSVRNPMGCSKCYCYGLTHSCKEAQGLIRMWLTLKPEQTVLPLVDKANTVDTRRGVSFQHPEILAHAELITSTISEPYYWKLPEQFKGSMITAYGGQLKYAVYYEARDEIGPSSYEPQVIIKGGPTHNIVMTRHIPGLQIGQLTRHEIDMTEHEWRYADGRSMTRDDFMDVLFYVDYILIRASHGNLMRHSRISEISLTVAEEGRPTKESEKARQIEKCDCPVGYSGLSCEECAAGFYRLRAGSPAPAPVSRVPTAVGMGSCVQCQCSGHSSTCDPETSICQNCQDNTEGDRCERCAPGFYGVVRGSPDDCSPCACPLTNPGNNFSPTCVAEGFDDYRCTACPEGYEGKYCERCATGYHGNPQMPGSHCEESCDDECSGLLISDMDRLYRIITDVTLTTPLPPPYKVLYRFENMTEELKATKVSADGEQVEDDADRIHKGAHDLEQFVRDILLGAKDLQSKADDLNQTLSRKDGTPDKSLKEMKEDIQAILAEELYQKVKRLFGVPHQATEDLKAEIKGKIADHEGKLQEAQDLLYSAQGKTRQAGSLAEQNKAILTALERKHSAVSQVKQEAQEVLAEGELLLGEANQLSGNIKDEIEDLQDMERELGPLHDQLDDKVSHLTGGLSDGRLANRVRDAEEHANQLNESAAILDGILAEAKNLSFNATAAFKAYSNIKANIDAAEKEAKIAKQRAGEALALKSQQLLNQARQLQYDVKENADNVAGLKGRVKAARDKTKDLLKAVNGTIATLNAIPNDTAAKLAATKAVAAEANATAIDVLERLGDLNLRLRGLQKNYTELKDTVNEANQMIQDPEKNIHAAGAKVKDLEDEADRLLEKLQPIKKLQDNLRRNISQIKELINQARKQANSVDFLALEMRKGKVNFLWDVGSGVGRVEYPHHTIHDGNWHRIEASRNGLNGTISVYPLEGSMAGMMPTPASSTSPTAYTILDVDQNAYLFVGGIFGTVKKADAVRTTTFTGCMGETFLDGKPIGLWNYRERQGECKGCVVSPQRSDGEGTVQLDGEGYAAVGRPTRWNPNVSTVSFKFRTFSSDALLMYLATEDLKDFMSLELSEGNVKVNFDLGSGVGSAISANRHNDGRWKSLTMSRNKKQVDVDRATEEKIEATSQGSATGLNLKENQKIYFGGLPLIANYRSEVTLKRYAGCLWDIEVFRTPYNLLSSTDYTGVTKGCNVENLYTVSFSKPGYMELGGLSLGVNTEISLSFSTLADNGTILLAVGGPSPSSQLAQRGNPISSKRRRRQSGEPYLSIMLNKGFLEVILFTGSHNTRRIIRRPDQGILNDGREHSLRIERLPGRTFAVQVDEEAKREAGLPNDQLISLQRIFLGGIPADVEQSSNRANVPFQGCIWNLMVNAVLSDFSQPVSFENAEIGQCPNLAPPPPLPPLPEEEKEDLKPVGPTSTPVTPAPLPPEPPADSCASAVAPTTIEKAHQFGLTRNSHMSFAFDDTKVRERLILEFELRTKEESGLVLYMARINHADFVSIQIKDGQVCLGYDLGHGNISGCVPLSINDGNWHTADLLDVVGMLYVGGLPQNYTTKRIGPILYSINGCIRNLKMVGGPVSTKAAATARSEPINEDFKLDMATPTASHMVGRCFISTETGTHFDGTGFLKAVSAYRVGLDVSITLEFRTSRTSGVLLAISNQVSDGLGLEIVQGKLLFHVDNGAGRVTAEHTPEGEGFCDGQWHTVTASKLRHRVELVVDGKQSQAESPNARSNTCDTNDPIYVGGYPDGVRQVALSTRVSFRGCMRNLKITKASKPMDVQFNKSLEIRGVQPLSCPAVAA
ncbi:Laminin subunit alpha-2 [Channa argus]|uniref:Laminin subunit alpha-2 n=1 Tax=Channa argus TaxID=215402 RepID=A0A6G1QKE1_CHAAH|nr:Laminin subunit alpha-2 [Channa argus]